MDEQRKQKRQQAIETIARRSGLVERLGNKVLRAGGGLCGMEGEAGQRTLDAIERTVARCAGREIEEVFGDDEALLEAAAWFESRAFELFREVDDRLADTASPFALLEQALLDPQMPRGYRDLQRARPRVLLVKDRGGRLHRVPGIEPLPGKRRK